MTATPHVRREPGVVMELWRGTFHVVLDGDDIGTIESHQVLGRSISSGPHTLQVTDGRYTSPVRSFTALDGDMIDFICNGSRIWPVYLASLVKRDLALTLRRE